MGCNGKIKYSSYGAARASAEALEHSGRVRGGVGERSNVRNEPYHCSECGGYHTGRLGKAVRAARLSKRGRQTNRIFCLEEE